MTTATVTEGSAGSAGAGPGRRTLEVWFAAVGAAAVLVLMGGFSLVITRTDEQAFATTLYPLLLDAGFVTGGDIGVRPATRWSGLSARGSG